MATAQNIAGLLRVKQVLDRLKAIDPATLTEREREAWQESLERSYDQAESLLTPEVMRLLVSDGTETKTEVGNFLLLWMRREEKDKEQKYAVS
jgi:hypothetical protein